MQSISLFFEKYQKLGSEQKNVKKIIQDLLKEFCDIDIETKNIQITNNEIKIIVVGPAKSQILIKKNVLNKNFQERIGKIGVIKNKKIS